MNEARFQALMREAFDEVEMSPWLNDVVRQQVAQPRPRSSRGQTFAIVAGVVLFALLAIALVPRMLQHRTLPVTPGVVATPTAVDWSSCTLPLIAHLATSLNTAAAWQIWPGFVNTATGQFTVDATASASVAQMPADRPYVGGSATEARVLLAPQPMSYSAPAHSWLPVSPNAVSPDGLSYVYIVEALDSPNASLPTGPPTTLMRYDVETRKSVQLWALGYRFFVDRWSTRGILVHGRGPVYWLIDPETGSAKVVPLDAWWALGYTLAGDKIQMGTSNGLEVYYDTASGKRVYIFGGPVTDDNAFNPAFAFGDTTGIWFSSSDPSPTLWHWDAKNLLHPLTVGAHRVMMTELAGPCF